MSIDQTIGIKRYPRKPNPRAQSEDTKRTKSREKSKRNIRTVMETLYVWFEQTELCLFSRAQARSLIRLCWPEVEGGWRRTVSRGGKGVNTRGRTVLLSRTYLCPHYPAHDSRCVALFPVPRSRISVSDGKSSFSQRRKVEEERWKSCFVSFFFCIEKNMVINYNRII